MWRNALMASTGQNGPVTRAGSRGACPRASTVSAMADTDIETKGAGTALAPGELVGEIERTRADLARTIDEIADRVAPKNVARRTADRALERLSQVDPKIYAGAAVAVAGVAGFLIWRKLRK